MLDANRPLRKGYIDVLSGHVAFNDLQVPIYNQFEDISHDDDNYILITSQNITDVSTKESFDCDCTIQLTIVTKGLLRNSGEAADSIGSQIKEKIYETRRYTPVKAEGFQIKSTQMTQDFTQQGFDDGKKKTITRIIIFEHKLYQLPSLI